MDRKNKVSSRNERSVIVVSSINADSTYSLDTLPLRGETVLSNNLTKTLGGKGANTAVASAKAGTNTYFIGAVGQNDNILSKLDHYNVNTSHCIHNASCDTGHAIIMLDHHGDNSIIVHSGANSFVTLDVLDAVENLLPQSVIVLHLEIPHKVVQDIAVRAHQVGATVVLNPSPVPRNHSPLLKQDAPLWQHVDVLIMNAVELGLIADASIPSFDHIPSGDSLSEDHIRSLEKILAQLRSRVSIQSSTMIIITLGSHGAIVQKQEDASDPENYQICQIPSLNNIKVVDSTGAGDCLTGYVSACLANNLDIIPAVQHGVIAAGICVTKSGTAQAVPDMASVKQQLPVGL